jgi:copper chaperone NosL
MSHLVLRARKGKSMNIKEQLFGKMSGLSRALLAVAGLLMLVGFQFPLWKISLWAPQYPEGLSLSIWINKFSGDVQTVNILNHYIGMAPIEEGSFPELQMFPKYFMALCALGLVVAAIGRRFGAWIYALVNVAFASWALYDFWSWEYKFGHDLNPDAAIKMEDMVYQPPLIGEKLFLNISASSWPDIAGIAFAVAVLLSLAVLVIELRRKNV